MPVLLFFAAKERKEHKKKFVVRFDEVLELVEMVVARGLFTPLSPVQ